MFLILTHLMALLNLPEKEFMSLFSKSIKFLAESTPEDPGFIYKLKYNNSKYFYDLNLENLIFTAKNKYELWLLVYRFLIQHTSVKIINKISFENDCILDISNEIIDTQPNDCYSIGEYWEIRNICNENLVDNTDYVIMQDIVDLVIDDLFYNKTLWIEKFKSKD